jgi:hypothetical protein
MDMTFWQWVGLIAGIVVLLFVGFSILGEYFRDKDYRKRKFREELVAAIEHSQPKWQQITEIAETSDIPVAVAHQITRELHKNILTGASQKLQPHRALIESYIASHRRAEPFEGLPNEIRIHLERLNDALGDKEHLLDPLTSEIRELVTIYKREYRLQKRYTSWGFFLGLVGLLFAAYAYLYPYVGGNPSSLFSTQQQPNK